MDMEWVGKGCRTRGMRQVIYRLLTYRHLIKEAKLIQHSGSIPGVSTHVIFFPKDGFGAAVLINSDGKNEVSSALSFRVAESILNLKRTDFASK